ncbi:5-(carboxyamino)imidazole ribonucleotide mutase [Candidatus Sororendozoicomonas aggregata]|uniref:5-(carboxyamino)imidazole ribonucleotide mutase n=1 Tax=Candidatus Sororendozoicomonas aggregata TaxID=3073239 RepID=UPI002ED35CE4
MPKPFAAILMGSDSDLPKIQLVIDVLKALHVPVEAKVLSALCTAETTQTYVKEADARGAAVFICCASEAAHLIGAVASLTVKPVIGVPNDSGFLDGSLSVIQMPCGYPLAMVSVGKDCAKNAAYLAAQIIALNDKELSNRLKMERKANAEATIARDAALQNQLSL